MAPKKRARRASGEASSSRGNSDPISFRDKEQQLRYNALSRRQLGVCRYVDEHTLNQLGLLDEVMSLVSNVGWDRFVRSKGHTYKELTLEFLSSLSMELFVSHDDAQGHMDFRLMGNDIRLTVEQLNDIFGFANNGLRKPPNTFIDTVAWRNVSVDNDYHPSKSKASHLHKHAHRYLHRVMAHTLFGRGESTGVVNKNEVFFLWCMEKGFKINTGIWLCKHLYHVSKGDKGKIMVGGFITHIAEALGVFDPAATSFSRVDGNERVDLELLMSMKFCTRFNGRLFLLNVAGQRVSIGEHNNEASAEEIGRAEEGGVHFTQAMVLHESHDSPVTLAQIAERLDRIEDNIVGCNQRMDRIEAKLDVALEALALQRGQSSVPPPPPSS